jgi:hypothetical protein
MEIVKARWREITNRAVTEDEAVSYKKGWQRDRLAVIHNDPPDDWRVRYERLVAEVGPSEDLIHAKESTASWYVPSSPKTSQELSEMTVTEIVQFLKTWQPSNEFMSASISGLGDQLAAAVAANPEKFGQEAQQFKDLDRSFVGYPLRVRSMVTVDSTARPDLARAKSIENFPIGSKSARMRVDSIYFELRRI